MPRSPSPPPCTRRPRSRYLPGGKPAHAYPLAHIAEGMAILAALDRHGLLTNGQVRDLLFADGPNRDGSPRGPAYARKLANLSLRRLWEGGLVRRQSAILTSARTGGPYLHFYNVLTPAGARAVADHLAASGDGPPRWSRSIYDLGPQQIDHSLLINDVYIRAHRAAMRAGLALDDWRDDRQLMAQQREGRAHFITVPDGFFALAGHGHFLEVDRGTETLAGRGRPDKAWARKIEGYGRYLTRLIGDDPPFAASAASIVLMVTLSAPPGGAAGDDAPGRGQRALLVRHGGRPPARRRPRRLLGAGLARAERPAPPLAARSPGALMLGTAARAALWIASC